MIRRFRRFTQIKNDRFILSVVLSEAKHLDRLTVLQERDASEDLSMTTFQKSALICEICE